MDRRLSRRALLCAFPGAALAADTRSSIPSESRKFRDPATEFELTRLTDPEKSNCWLPRSPLRALDRQDNSLLYCSDRNGSLQAWRMDLRSGVSRQLSAASAMIPSTLTLARDDRTIVFFDGPALVVTQNKPRTVYKLESGWSPEGHFAIADDGATAAFVENKDTIYRLRVVNLSSGQANTVLESDKAVRFLRFRPRNRHLAYGHGGELAIIAYDGRGDRHIKVAEGIVTDAQWSADGKAIHYLSAPRPGERRSVQLREFLIETSEDKMVGPTTQFVSFARNSDSSVFAGISGSKASPYLLLLLRAARRELTVAEHKASEPAKASVIFSGSSQRLYYETDRQGKSAIYTIELERFIEKTEISAAVDLLQPA